MAIMTVIYKTPKDKEAFDKHYFEVHVPLAKQLPGLIKYEVGRGPIISTTGDNDVYLIGYLFFDSMEAMKASFATEIGKDCAADRKILAGDDMVQIYLSDVSAV
jgi:uncharacterized protein (TIGR02118 family)